MFAKFVGRRATALATSLAVIIGLAVTPAFTATAAEGDQPVIVEAPIAELVEAPPAESSLPADEAPAPAAEAPAPLAEEAPAPLAEDPAPLAEGPAPLAEDPLPLAESVEAPPVDQGGDEAHSPIAPLSARVAGAAAQPESTGFTPMAMVASSTGIQPNTVGPLVAGQSVYIRFSHPGADRWRISSVPYGLTFYRSTGELAGTVHYADTYSFTVTAEDRYFANWYDDLAEKTYTVTVENAAPVIITNELASAVVGVAYSQGLMAAGAGPKTFRVTSGSLPLGLSLSPSGVISGTPAFDNSYTAYNRVYFGVTANNGRDSVQKLLSILVATPSPQFGNAPLATATPGVAYVQALPLAVGYGTLTYGIHSGSLPGGLALGSDGVIRGTPVYDASYAATQEFTFTARVSGQTGTGMKTFKLTLQVAPPTVTTTTLPAATVGTAYAAPALAASGDGTITWSATGLPAGLVLDSATGIISGTPDYNPAFGVTTTVPVTVTANNGFASAPQALSLTVNTPAPVFGARRLPAATVGMLYDQPLPVSNAYGDLTYALVGARSLPSGLQLTADGRILGTPDYDPTAGESKAVTIRVQVTGTAGSDAQAFRFNLRTPAPKITTTTLPDGWWKQAYNQPIAASGPGVVVTVTGLPANLHFDGTIITGTTRMLGTFELQVTAINTAGVDVEKVYLTINDKPSLQPLDPVIVRTGGFGIAQIPFTGEDVRLSLADTSSGLLMFNDLVLLLWPTPGTYTFTVNATNPAGTDSRTYTFKVFDVPVITHGALDQGVTNMAYSAPLDHDGTNAKFTVVKGDLPAGMTLTKAGVLEGTPTEAGTFRFRVKAKNPIGVDRQWFTLTVTQPAATLSAATIIRGNTLTVSGSGYLLGDELELWLHSTPVMLGTVTATDGTFTRTVTIPANTPAGAHHLVVVGAQSGTQSMPLTVALPAAAPQPAAPQSSAQSQSPQLTVTPSVETTTTDESDDSEVEETVDEAEEDLPTLNKPEADGETTAATPANWTGLLLAALVLLLAALLVAFVLWRRRMASGS